MRLVYAFILISGFQLHWGWYVAASVVWLAGIGLPFLKKLWDEDAALEVPRRQAF